MPQQISKRQCFFPIDGELRPHRSHTCFIRDETERYTLRGYDCCDAFSNGEGINQLILLPEIASLRVRVSTPQVNNFRAIDGDTH